MIRLFLDNLEIRFREWLIKPKYDYLDFFYCQLEKLEKMNESF